MNLLLWAAVIGVGYLYLSQRRVVAGSRAGSAVGTSGRPFGITSGPTGTTVQTPWGAVGPLGVSSPWGNVQFGQATNPQIPPFPIDPGTSAPAPDIVENPPDFPKPAPDPENVAPDPGLAVSGAGLLPDDMIDPAVLPDPGLYDNLGLADTLGVFGA